MSGANQLILSGIGSTDWAGGTAPAGGLHTGTSTITMQDGTKFVVSHSRGEVNRKRGRHAVAQTSPNWVAFDAPLTAVPLVLNVDNIQTVT